MLHWWLVVFRSQEEKKLGILDSRMRAYILMSSVPQFVYFYLFSFVYKILVALHITVAKLWPAECFVLLLYQTLSESECDDIEILHLQERANRLLLREYDEPLKEVMTNYFSPLVVNVVSFWQGMHKWWIYTCQLRGPGMPWFLFSTQHRRATEETFDSRCIKIHYWWDKSVK